MLCFVLSGTLWLGGCISEPPAEPLDLHWQFAPQDDGTARACLPEEDVEKLKEALDRCRAKAAECSP